MQGPIKSTENCLNAVTLHSNTKIGYITCLMLTIMYYSPYKADGSHDQRDRHQN